MEAQTYTGYVEKILDEGSYDREFVVTNYKDLIAKDAMMEAFKERKSKDFPTALKFKANIKSGVSALLDDVNEGDKVEVKFCLSGMSGVSKKTGNYYCIVNLNACKNGIRVIERAGKKECAGPMPEEIDPSDLPF